MAALEPYRLEPEHVLDVADDDSSDDNKINERLLTPKLQKNVFVVLFTLSRCQPLFKVLSRRIAVKREK